MDYSTGYAVNIAVSELYSFSSTPLTYSQQITQTARQMSDGSAQFVVSYASDVSMYPRYVVNPSTYRTFAQPKVPVLILVGTLDPNTEHGLGYFFKKGLGDNATLLSIPYATHGSISYDTPCVNSIVLSFLESSGKTYDTSCISTSPDFYAPDFNGGLQSTMETSTTYFGTSILWNNEGDDFVPPTSIPTSEPCKQSNNEPSCDYNTYGVTKLTVALVVPLCIIILILIGIIASLIMTLKNRQTNNDQKDLL